MSIKTSRLLSLALALAACAPKPPVIAYMTVGTYDGRCGYDWNGAAVDVERVPELAKAYDGPREAAILFRYDPVDERCFRAAYAALRKAGFWQVHVVRGPQPPPNSPRPIP